MPPRTQNPLGAFVFWEAGTQYRRSVLLEIEEALEQETFFTLEFMGRELWNVMRKKLGRGMGECGERAKHLKNKEARQTRDLRVANGATLRAARPDPSAGKERPLQDDKTGTDGATLRAARPGPSAGKERPLQDDKTGKDGATLRAARPGPSAGKKRPLQDAGERRTWVMGCKERGEWAELCFMAKVAGMGLSVSKPYGESQRYDVLVDAGATIWRVQVKSTLYRRRGNEYSLNVMGPGRKAYKKGTVDFFAVYLIPADEWYIIPYEALGKKLTLHFCPGGGRQKYKKYRQAWSLFEAPEAMIYRHGEKTDLFV